MMTRFIVSLKVTAHAPTLPETVSSPWKLHVIMVQEDRAIYTVDSPDRAMFESVLRKNPDVISHQVIKSDEFSALDHFYRFVTTE